MFKLLWLFWVVIFAVLETAAILLGEGTLTETIVENIHWEIAIALFGALALWVPAHFYAAYKRKQYRAEVAEEIAQAIWDDEQKCQSLIRAYPTNVHLNGRLVGLQRARDIANQHGETDD